MFKLDDNTLLYIIANKAYPVGSVYMSEKDTDPSVLFGGKWEQLNDSISQSIYAWKRIA